MGTNFDLERDCCEHCGRPADRLHIGKSSGGWCFALNTHPEADIRTLDDWRREWSKPGAVIRDECGDTLTADRMLLIITERACAGFADWTPSYLHRNHAEAGPNNLLRHRIDGRFCIGHGDGTFDYMSGEFS